MFQRNTSCGTVCYCQIVEALAYLHSVEQVVHLNVSPQSVVITKRGMWKLAGFAFAVSSNPDQLTVRRTATLFEVPTSRRQSGGNCVYIERNRKNDVFIFTPVVDLIQGGT